MMKFTGDWLQSEKAQFVTEPVVVQILVWTWTKARHPWVGQAAFPITKRPRDGDRTSFLAKAKMAGGQALDPPRGKETWSESTIALACKATAMHIYEDSEGKCTIQVVDGVNNGGPISALPARTTTRTTTNATTTTTKKPPRTTFLLLHGTRCRTPARAKNPMRNSLTKFPSPTSRPTATKPPS